MEIESSEEEEEEESVITENNNSNDYSNSSGNIDYSNLSNQSLKFKIKREE